MNTLPLPPYVELGVHSLSGLLWTLLLLFLWHCYRMGSDLPIPGHAHAGKLKSGSRRSMMSRGGSCAGTKCNARSMLSRSDQITPFISMETEEDEELGRGYLTPVLSHALFPAQASAEAKKLYAALQEYAKRYSWVGMGRIHKGLREQVQVFFSCKPWSGAWYWQWIPCMWVVYWCFINEFQCGQNDKKTKNKKHITAL